VVRQVGEELWVVETPLRYFVEMGRRMSVVRLGGEALWVHSPAELTADLRGRLDELGQVRFVVPASNLHGHLFMEQYAAAYPEADLFAAHGLRQKRPDLRFAGDLDDRPDPRWAAEIDQAVFRGHRLLDEVVFLHRRSRSLIVGDTCFNVEPGAPLLLRLWAWGPRLRPMAAPTPLFRRAIRDRQAARRSVERILQWDFDRIVIGHGAIVESDGKETWRRAWGWV
jgi:Domain of unknown function (DUF4336)